MIVTERFARRQTEILLSLYSITGTPYSASLSIVVVVVVAGLFFVFGEGRKTQRKL